MRDRHIISNKDYNADPPQLVCNIHGFATPFKKLSRYKWNAVWFCSRRHICAWEHATPTLRHLRPTWWQPLTREHATLERNMGNRTPHYIIHQQHCWPFSNDDIMQTETSFDVNVRYMLHYVDKSQALKIQWFKAKREYVTELRN